jgi:hypothetical protein
MSTSTSHEDHLAERLHHLADTIDGPVPTAAVVRRGRGAVRRNRVLGTAAALSVFTTAGVLGATSGLLGHHGDGQRFAAGSPKTSAAKTHGRRDGKKPSPRKTPSTPWCERGIQAYHAGLQKYGGTLTTYRNLVVEDLDPQRQHLEASASDVQASTGKGCALDGLGTKLGWTSAGDDGLGMVRVEVTTDWSQAQIYLAHGAWRPAGSLPAGAVDAYVADYDGGIAVAVTRADGTTVALDAALLFGNNSVTPVASMDLTAGELLVTAADPRFQMP